MKKYLLQTTFYSVLFLQPLFFSIPTAAWSISSPPQLIDNTYVASDNPKFSFKYSNDLKLSPKLLKTHNKEVFLKSEEVKGFNVGITVDPVKINSIKQFSTPSDLAKRVIEVERSKEGFMDAEVLGARASVVPAMVIVSSSSDGTGNESDMSDGGSTGIDAYDLEYQVESTRGLNHYNVRTTILNKNLFVFTVQYRQEDTERMRALGVDILDSLRIDASPTMK